MDVTFLGDIGKAFSIEVGFFDSFLEIKEKIKKYQGIPVNMQKLFFNGKLLKDDDIVINSNLIQGSCIVINLAQYNKSIELKLRVMFPKYRSLVYTQQVYMDETIMQLKEKIHNKYNFFKINDMSLMFLFGSKPCGPVLDHQSLLECGVSDNEIVSVITKKQNQEASLPESTSRRSKILNLNVIPLALRMQIGIKMDLKVQIESCAKVSELKKVLEYKYKCFVREDGCHFFMHETYVMCENESFEWNQVSDGDTILLCEGYVQNMG